MSQKIIRDPVHDVIAFRIDRPEERLLFDLANTPEMQRLRRVRQLGLASLAYPGADHARFGHCLGVMETARRMLRRLAEQTELDPWRSLVCQVAALLHDVGHGPFSHVFERITQVAHEEITRRVIEDPDSRVHQVLAAHDRALPGAVLDLMLRRPAPDFYADILSSQLDADRFDYLLRDNLMTGSRYGYFDLTWLLAALTLDETGRRLAVEAKGLSAVEDYLQARYHMYRNVYFHKVVRSAEGMVRLALQRARLLAAQDRLGWPPREHPVSLMLLGRSLDIRQFNDLDDISILTCFKLWAQGDDGVLARLCHGLLNRELYKVIELDPAVGDGPAVLAAARAAVEAAGGDGAYDVFLDEPAESPFARAHSPILIRGRDGRTRDLAVGSAVLAALEGQLVFRRLHVVAEYKAAVVAPENSRAEQ